MNDVNILVCILQDELGALAEEMAFHRNDAACGSALRVVIALTVLRDAVVLGWDRSGYNQRARAVAAELTNLGDGRTVERVRAFVSEYFDLTEVS